MDKDIVVVIATNPELAFAEYDRYSVYMCPAPKVPTEDGNWKNSSYAKRRFWKVSHCGFYFGNKIHPIVPKIQARIESVWICQEGVDELSSDDVKGQDFNLIKQLLQTLVTQLETDENPPTDSRLYNPHQVFFLSKPSQEDTIDLSVPIINNKLNESGGSTAFTQKFCYVTLPSLRAAKVTTDLELVK